MKDYIVSELGIILDSLYELQKNHIQDDIYYQEIEYVITKTKNKISLKMKKVIPNQAYNMPELKVVLKGYQINNAMEKAWTEIHSRVIPFKGDLQKEMEVITRKNIIEGNY